MGTGSSTSFTSGSFWGSCPIPLSWSADGIMPRWVPPLPTKKPHALCGYRTFASATYGDSSILGSGMCWGHAESGLFPIQRLCYFYSDISFYSISTLYKPDVASHTAPFRTRYSTCVLNIYLVIAQTHIISRPDSPGARLRSVPCTLLRPASPFPSDPSTF